MRLVLIVAAAAILLSGQAHAQMKGRPSGDTGASAPKGEDPKKRMDPDGAGSRAAGSRAAGVSASARARGRSRDVTR